MNDATVADRLRDNATEIASLVVTGVWLAALLTGQSWWLVALIVGYAAVVPIVSLVFGDDDEAERDWWKDLWNSNVVVASTGETDNDSDEPAETPLETLRRRYAAGELTDEQFERKLERLLETETLEDAEERVARERLREREF